MLDYKKPLYLPSNGLEYDKVIYIKPLRQDVYILFNDPLYNLSTFELIISIMEKHISVDPLRLYRSDFFYIWSNFLMQMNEIQEEDSDLHKMMAQCMECETLNHINVRMSEFDIKYLDVYCNGYLRYFEEIEGLKLAYRRRKVVDSIEFSMKELDKRDEGNMAELMRYHFMPQLESVVHDGKEVPKRDYYDLFKSYRTSEIADIYSALNESDFGMENEITFKCAKCNHESEETIFDDAMLSLIIPKESEPGKIHEQMSMMLQTSRLPVFNFKEVSEMPASYFKIAQERMQNMDFHQLF